VKLQIEQEAQAELDKQKWLAELEIVYQKFYKLAMPDFVVTSKDYYDAEGKTPREYLGMLLEIQQDSM
jgi:hypothetical protein